MKNNQKTIYLHIGMPKAGSSSIQNYLTNVSKQFEENKILYYPQYQTKPANLWQAVFGEYRKGLKYYNKHIKKYFLERIENTQCEKIILSNEGIWTICNTDVCDIFLEHDFNLKVIAYIRKPVEYLVSSWQENIKTMILKMGTSLSLNEFLKLDTNYYKLKDFIEKLGRENVIIRPFESEQWYKNNLLNDFLNSIGVNVNADLSAYPHANDYQLNRNFCEFLYLIKNSNLNQSEYIETIIKYLKNFTTEEEKKLINDRANYLYLANILKKYVPSKPKVIETIGYEKIVEITKKWEPQIDEIARIYGKKTMFNNILPDFLKENKPEKNYEITFNSYQIEILKSLLKQKRTITKTNKEPFFKPNKIFYVCKLPKRLIIWILGFKITFDE